MSQPTISEHIRLLESNLGCRLFDRLGRSIRPTKKAEILVPKALAILESIATLEEALDEEERCVRGELILGASSIPGAYVLPPLAAAFTKKYPEISLEVNIADSAEIIDAILNHDLLLGIVGSRIQSHNATFTPFLEDELVLVMAAAEGGPKSVSFDTLRTLPFLLREQGSGTRKAIEEMCLQRGRHLEELNTVAVLGSNAAIKEAIKANLGVSIVSRVSIADEIACGTVREVSIAGVELKRMFYLVTSTKRTLPNHYQLFLNDLGQVSSNSH